MVVTIVAGVVLSLALLAIGRRIDNDRDTVRDDAALAAARAGLNQQLATLSGQVLDVAGLFEASHSVTPAEFAAFADPMLKRSGATALTFLQNVTAAQRPAFERAHGPLKEIAANGSLRPAATRPRYLVVTRGAFSAGEQPVNDVDVLSQPDRHDAIEQAERTDTVAATDLVKLARTRRGGLLVYAPVHGPNVQGVVSGSFAVSVLESAMRRSLGEDVRMRVEASNGPIATAGPRPAGDAPHRNVVFGGRTYKVTAEAAPDDGLRFSLLAPLAGIALTLLAVLGQSARRSRRRVAIGEARFADAFEASPIGQALATPEGRLARVNVGLCTITGYDRTALLEREAADLLHPDDRECADELIAEALAAPGVAAGAEVRLLTAGGTTRWAQLHFTRLRDPGATHPLLTQVIDVSDRRGLEVELRHQAEHDALTELLNRRGFQRRLGAFIGQGAPGALMLIDLDHFKAVNDTLGHHVGDQVIHAAGSALRGSVRSDDIVGRLGGDEFAVLLPGADRERARNTAERLVQAISTQGLPAAHGVSASVGVAMLGGFADADEALMAADLAMYDAKEAGRRRAAFYDSDTSSGTHSRLQWVDRIRSALAEERFVLLAQPIADLATGKLAHHELLLRMLDEDGEQVLPDAFLPIAEQFGLMAEIDRWVATTAIAQLAAHAHRGLVFEVNLSGSSLGSPELLDAIRDALVQGGVAPGRLIFEITETEAVTNLEEAHAFALQLAALGCRFALDDFGVGFGSFTYVKHLPFDFLKIDGEFVRHSATSEPDRVILESLIHAARGLGKRTIAEYVTDAQTEELLRELGVDLVQGYLIGRPRSLAEVIAEAPLTSSSRALGGR